MVVGDGLHEVDILSEATAVDANAQRPPFPVLRLSSRRIYWAHQDSNLGPRDYESPALTAEL
jgi:hypothetical protein